MMTVRWYRCFSPGTRFRSVGCLPRMPLEVKERFDKDSSRSIRKALTSKKKAHGGRNNRGVITARRLGGAHKKRYRRVDFRRSSGECVLCRVEYDPNRSSWLGLVMQIKSSPSVVTRGSYPGSTGSPRYDNLLGTRTCTVRNFENPHYIVLPSSLKELTHLYSGEEAPISEGNSMPLSRVPVGSMVHNVELTKGKGGQLVRAAGVCAKLLAREEGFATLKLPSREFRQVHEGCYATLGGVSNPFNANIVMGKAGRRRWLGRRPMTRGSAMNVVDHPHGGGEGKAPIGKPQPLNMWGKATRCVKTRNKKKKSTERIVRRRVTRKRKR